MVLWPVIIAILICITTFTIFYSQKMSSSRPNPATGIVQRLKAAHSNPEKIKILTDFKVIGYLEPSHPALADATYKEIKDAGLFEVVVDELSRHVKADDQADVLRHGFFVSWVTAIALHPLYRNQFLDDRQYTSLLTTKGPQMFHTFLKLQDESNVDTQMTSGFRIPLLRLLARTCRRCAANGDFELIRAIDREQLLHYIFSLYLNPKCYYMRGRVSDSRDLQGFESIEDQEQEVMRLCGNILYDRMRAEDDYRYQSDAATEARMHYSSNVGKRCDVILKEERYLDHHFYDVVEANVLFTLHIRAKDTFDASTVTTTAWRWIEDQGHGDETGNEFARRMVSHLAIAHKCMRETLLDKRPANADVEYLKRTVKLLGKGMQYNGRHEEPIDQDLDTFGDYLKRCLANAPKNIRSGVEAAAKLVLGDLRSAATVSSGKVATWEGFIKHVFGVAS